MPAAGSAVTVPTPPSWLEQDVVGGSHLNRLWMYDA